MSKFVSLPNGDNIRADVIFAVRIGEARTDDFLGYSVKPRVIVDFGSQLDEVPVRGLTNSVICNCETNDERDALAASIMDQIKTKVPQ